MNQPVQPGGPYTPLSPGPSQPGIPTTGQTIAGRYDLVRLIGKGGMGAVYEARHRETRKRCALKLLLSDDLLKNQEMLARFQREARACAAIESEHIVQVFDSGWDSQAGVPFMVMELLVGEDLDQVSEHVGPLEPDVAAKLILQACIGLGKAHEAGIVHRDIKLANLFLTHRDSAGLTVKLLDFGIAKVKMENFAQTAGAAGNNLTRTGSMLGTPLYMSPEQARGASQVDARCDVWSMGIALYRLLTGRTPFENANSLGELLVGIITGQVPPVQDLAPWVPPEIARIVGTALERDLSLRYANAVQMRDALMGICPQGAFVSPDMLTPLPEEKRKRVAPKLLTTSGLKETGSGSGLAVTNGKTSFSKESHAGRWAAFVGLGLLALGGATGVVLLARSKQPVLAETVIPAMDSVVPAGSDTAPAAEASAGLARTSRLRVAPEGVEVFVDDSKVDVLDGSVSIIGIPGTTRRVRLTFKGAVTEQVVAITQDGLIPPALVVESKATAPTAISPSKGGKKTASDDRTAATGKTPAAPPPATGKKPPPRVSNDTAEFEK